MSKNIDEIVKKVIPLKETEAFEISEMFEIRANERNKCRDWLKQAITEKKLVVPMSENEIYTMIHSEIGACVISSPIERIAKAIYERQFKGDE